MDITLIVPVYNDPSGIESTLRSLIDQPAKEVLVVDNASTDSTQSVVKKYESKREIVSLLVEEQIQSSYAARNTGIRSSTGDIFVFVDADMTVPEDWLAAAHEEFRRTNADYMGCAVELTLPDDPTLAARYDHHTGFPVEQYIEHQRFAPTCCLFVRRAVVEDVGLFDHRLISGGDKEFGDRVFEAGYTMHFARDIRMYHPTRNSLRELVKKDRRVGRGLCQLQRYHPERFGTPGVPPRPSGIKRPETDLSMQKRLTFGAVSKLLTGIRGLGYYEEYLKGSDESDLKRNQQLVD